uniref:C2H2-type domain-containing protein n=1 Tax=Buteo japonicus TaxID=224669 RepID=A0A8C0B1P6_9AVES
MEQPAMMTLELLEVENFLSHTWEKSYTCMICGDSFKHKGILAAHQNSHKEEIEAEGCEEGDDDQAGEMHDQEAIRGGEEPPTTLGGTHAFGQCGKTFTKKGNLANHQRAHAEGEGHRCGACGKGFAKRGELTKHERTQTGEKPYGCGQCGKRFAQPTQLVTHQHIHTGERPYPCGDCGKRFDDKSRVTVHRRIHTGDRPFLCPTCGKGFRQKIALVKHRRVHERGRDKGGSEDTSADTEANGNGEANGDSHANANTDASVKTDANVKTNANAKLAGKDEESPAVPCRLLPVGERPFSCSECGKAFAQKAQLAVHHRIHTGERPFPCADCPKAFIDKSRLVIHRCTHTGERPFPCAACSRAFTQKVALTAHQRVHTREHQPPSSPHFKRFGGGFFANRRAEKLSFLNQVNEICDFRYIHMTPRAGTLKKKKKKDQKSHQTLRGLPSTSWQELEQTITGP